MRQLWGAAMPRLAISILLMLLGMISAHAGGPQTITDAEFAQRWAGAFGGLQFEQSNTSALGLDAGYAWQSGPIVYGIDAKVMREGDAWRTGVTGRIGLDWSRLQPFLRAGLSLDSMYSEDAALTLGAGAQWALTDRLSASFEMAWRAGTQTTPATEGFLVGVEYKFGWPPIKPPPVQPKPKPVQPEDKSSSSAEAAGRLATN